MTDHNLAILDVHKGGAVYRVFGRTSPIQPRLGSWSAHGSYGLTRRGGTSQVWQGLLHAHEVAQRVAHLGEALADRTSSSGRAAAPGRRVRPR
jgi:hypothetical protein